MSRRSGATLIEVLVSIFVMAIGLIALLALFPLGAIQMAQAIKDDRVAACVANATALAEAWNLRHDTGAAPLTNYAAACFDNPDATVAKVFNQNASAANPNGPSYPVYVDPIGFNSYILPANKRWLAGLDNLGAGPNKNGIPRCTASFVTLPTTMNAVQWCTLQDDITFTKSGTPDTSNGFVERAGSFSWAYLLRRPLNCAPGVVEMSIVVYQQRSLSLNGVAVGGDETWFTTAAGLPFNPATPNVVTLAVGLTKPPVRAGSWILDCTAGPRVGGKATPPNARFYRVVGVSEPQANQMALEVDTPIQSTPNLPNRFAILENVVEVVYKGTNWRP
jgi:hypothetical protein